MTLNEYSARELLVTSKINYPTRFNDRSALGNWGVQFVDTSQVLSRGFLDIQFDVKRYKVKMRLLGFDVILKHFVDNPSDSNSSLDTRITGALLYALSLSEVLVSCDCPDFLYRFSYTSNINGYGYDYQNIPSIVTNPTYKVGICKHIMQVLNSPSIWLRLVTRTIKREVVLKYRKGVNVWES